MSNIVWSAERGWHDGPELSEPEHCSHLMAEAGVGLHECPELSTEAIDGLPYCARHAALVRAQPLGRSDDKSASWSPRVRAHRRAMTARMETET